MGATLADYRKQGRERCKATNKSAVGEETGMESNLNY